VEGAGAAGAELAERGRMGPLSGGKKKIEIVVSHTTATLVILIDFLIGECSSCQLI